MITLTVDIPASSKEVNKLYKQFATTNGTMSVKKLTRLIETAGVRVIITDVQLRGGNKLSRKIEAKCSKILKK